nr:MAG TPA: hypothetical protein [Caudoviricetes sp.]DAK77143.1 MAG TPA: hypothetical protein [Caudoviricetes sp.]
MSHNFRPGDLALTLATKFRFPAMSQVELIVFLREDQKAEESDGNIWTAPYDGWVAGRGEGEGYGFYKPSQLMPLRGDFTSEQQKAKEVEPCL